MAIDINKQEVDIDTLFKQNELDLSYIKELYRKLKDLEKKIYQIKYIDSNLADKLKKDYEKLKRIILDENIQAKLTNDINEIDTSINTINNDINEINSQLDKKALQSDLLVERERINNLTKLGEGSTTGDAELIDGRIGANGTTYTTIGENIRDIAKGNGILNKSIKPYKTDFVSYEDIMLQDGIVVGALNSVGTINSSITSANTSNFISVEEGMNIEIPGNITYLAYYNVNKVSLVSALGRLSNLKNYKGVIPTHTDKVKYIRITWSNQSSDVNYRVPTDINIFRTDKLILTTPFKENSINLSAINGINNENDIYFDYAWNTLTVYMKTIAKNTYLGYRFIHKTAEYNVNNSSSNYDIWRLRGVGVYTKEGSTFKDILTDGLIHEASEWECAIKETGMSDFVGGSTHGDEFIESIVFILDGNVYTDPTQFSTKTCKELRIIRKSKLYRANTNSETYIADHYVDYLFKNNEIIIDNRVDWKVDTNCGISYLCMLGAKRLNGTTQITNKGIKQGDGSVLDVSTEGHSNNGTTKRCTKAYLWNDGSNGGVNVSMSVEILENNFFPNFNFKFDNRADYNKFYFDQCGLNFNVKNGDIWFNKALYKIDYYGLY